MESCSILNRNAAQTSEVSEVDVKKLGPLQRKELVERLVGVSEEDREKFLLRLKERLDRVGIDVPTIEVRYEHLNVEAKAHIGNRGSPTIVNFLTNILEGCLNFLHILPSKKKPVSILQDVSGIIKPAKMTLLLGPPASGKTTLLLALAGKLDSALKCLGRVTYNGHGMDEFVPQRIAAYISQHDLHIGEMTVRETLDFSARCQGIGSRHDMLTELSRREKEANIKPDPDIDIFMKGATTEGQQAKLITEYVLKVLGLESCADTMVGDGMIRGISGGQRKRVTVGELLVGPAKVLLMDEISTGLDTSTTYQIVSSLKQYVHILKGSALISLLQPAPETYDLFDDVILLSDGQVAYHGPRDQVLEFFESMGFKCPERKGVADFLQEVTSRKDQKQYWVGSDEHYAFVTVKDFAEAFKSSPAGQRLYAELAAPLDERKTRSSALTREKYGVGKMELLRASFSRELLLMRRNSFVYIFKLIRLTVMGMIAMTVFLRTEMHRNSLPDGGIYLGALFFSVTMLMFNGLAEVSMTVAKLPVFYKQRDLLFYPPWAYALPQWILKIPLTLVETSVWVAITYYAIGFDPSVVRLFKQYLVLLLVTQMASALFRLIAAMGRTMPIAGTFGALALLMLFALGGVVLSRASYNVKKWWIWGYWVSPLMYGQNAIVVNEFLGKKWSHVIPNTNETLGVEVLKSRGFFTHSYMYWIGIAALAGHVMLFNAWFTLALTYLNPFKKLHAVELIDKTELVNQNRKKGMALPFEPHSITFHEITYSVGMPQEMKEIGIVEEKLLILKGLSGSFRPGVLTALMGASGAGKTTLMDVLAGKKTYGYIGGSINISGYPKNQATFARVCGYCEQNDIHSPHVTVYESLLYSAWLRLSPDVKSDTRRAFIDEVMEILELNPLKQAMVGLPGVDGLSTQQRKRLTIAVELVANPSMIFMDEPTSGLDARAAAFVMRMVRNTVDTGRTVVCTIHQPGIDIFDAFDELFLMRGGEEIYVGPIGRNSCHLIAYFEAIKGVRKIRDGYNPATWMLEISTATQELNLGVDFAELYRKSELYRKNKALIQETSVQKPGSEDLHFPTKYSQSFTTQFTTCLWKQHWSYWRNPQYTAIRLLFTVFIAFMFGTMFWGLGSNVKVKQDVFNAMGSMYTAVMFIGIQNANSVQPVVAVGRTVHYRENAAGMYSPMAYAFAQVAIELPYVLVQSMVYGTIVYAMIGFEWTPHKFSWYLFFMFFSFLHFTFYGMMAVAVTPNHHIANIIASAFYALWNLFCGFILPRTRIPIWWRWYYWACPVAWTLYGLVATQFGDKNNMIESGETVKQFLESYFGYKQDFVGVVASAVVGIALLFAFTFALSIKMFNFQRR